jgi:hypothetical protein
LASKLAERKQFSKMDEPMSKIQKIKQRWNTIHEPLENLETLAASLKSSIVLTDKKLETARMAMWVNRWKEPVE